MNSEKKNELNIYKLADMLAEYSRALAVNDYKTRVAIKTVLMDIYSRRDFQPYERIMT